MRSMRARLFLILIAATGLVWMSATAWVYLSTRAEVEHVLDARLMEAARMVSSLIDSQEIDTAVASLDPDVMPDRRHSPYERQLSCQIWSLTGTLIGKSDGAPAERLSDHPDGFAERSWRRSCGSASGAASGRCRSWRPASSTGPPKISTLCRRQRRRRRSAPSSRR